MPGLARASAPRWCSSCSSDRRRLLADGDDSAEVLRAERDVAGRDDGGRSRGARASRGPGRVHRRGRRRDGAFAGPRTGNYTGRDSFHRAGECPNVLVAVRSQRRPPKSVVLWLAPLPSTGWCPVHQPGDAPARRAAPTGLVPSGGRHQPCFVPRMLGASRRVTTPTRHDVAGGWRCVRVVDTAASACLTSLPSPTGDRVRVDVGAAGTTSTRRTGRPALGDRSAPTRAGVRRASASLTSRRPAPTVAARTTAGGRSGLEPPAAVRRPGWSAVAAAAPRA